MSKNIENTTENKIDLSKSYCEPYDTQCDGTTNSRVVSSNDQCTSSYVNFNKCSETKEDETDKSGNCKSKIKTRKMRSPDEINSAVFKKLFANLFNNDISTLKPDDGKLSDKNDTDSESDSDSDSEYDDVDEGNDSCDHIECHLSSDPRWKALNKLLKSHVILTRSVADLVRDT